MCFASDGESDVWDVEWPRARKSHYCDECLDHTIEPGEQHQRIGSLYDGSWRTFRFCERCIYLQALIVAHEIGEGCTGQEATYPIGDGLMREYICRDLGMRLAYVEVV